MKLKKCLVVLPLLALTLSACNSTRVSEPLDDSETSEETSSEETSQTGEEETQTTFTNYTLSIEIRYNGDVEKVPEYATAYIQGGWDSWTSWVALTENNDRYEYSFASLDLGTYEYQLVLAYENDDPSWTYRITQDGANASFTVKEGDGDNYKNEVTVTASKALSEIIPDPNAAINNVKVTIDITLDGVSQEVLDYGSLWIEGSWDWSEGFVKCDVEEGHYTYTFTSLAPIEYEFLGVIYYKDEQLPDDNSLWDYKVNGDANCKFTVETSSVSATLVATKALSEILPPIGGDTGDEGGTGGDDDEGKGGDQKEDENSKVIAAIISSLSDLGYLDEEWDAVHVTDIDEDDVTTDYYVTSDDDYYLYGKYESGDAYGYYTEKMLYEYDGEEYSSRSYNNQYDDFVGAYSDPLDVIDELEDEYSDYADLSTDSEGNYVLTYDLTEEDDAVFTFVATSSYDIIEMGYVDDSYGDNYIVAKYTVAEVQVKMQGFNINDWTPAVTEVSNYTLSFTLTYESSVDSVPEGAELRIVGSWDNDESWDTYHVLTQVGQTYQYTISSIGVLGEDDDWYTYELVLGYSDEEWVNWDYKLTFEEGVYTTFGVNASDGDNYTNDITLALSSPMSEVISDLISEYTLTVTINYGGSAETLPTWADLYINGSWANSEELGWDNFEQLTPDDQRTSFTLTIKDVHPGWYEYDLVMVQAGETPASGWSNTHRITPEGSKGYFEIEKGTAVGSTSYESETALAEIYGDPEAETSYTDHVISITLTDTSGAAISVPEWVSVYALFNFDEWATHELTRVSDSTFTYTVSSITSGSYSYSLDVDYAGDSLTWGSHQLANGVAFEIAKDDEDNQTDITLKTSLDFAAEFPEPGSTGGDEPSSGSVSVYFLIIDNTNITDTNSIDWCFNFNYDVSGAYEGIFTTNGDQNGWYNCSNVVGTTATVSSQTHVAVYNETPGEMAPGEEVWMNLKNWNSTEEVWQSYYFGCTVPEGSSGAITFVGYADLTAFNSSITSSNTFSNEVTITSYSGTPSEVLAIL